MQKEIRKRASLYGVVAILLAILFSALCYNFGVIPQSAPPSGPQPTQPTAFMGAFSSEEELRNYLLTNSKSQGSLPYYGPSNPFLSSRDVLFLESEGVQVQSTTEGLKLYSTTNIQVAGVDEADIAKADDQGYIYLVSCNNVYILKAYPPEQAEVLSVITFNDTYPAEIFISGDRLTVLGSRYRVYPMGLPWYYYQSFTIDIKTFANVYDISNRQNPVSLENFTMSGSYFNARMIGDYVYFVVSQPAYVIYDTVILPKIYSDNGIEEISASEIRYSNASCDYYLYTTIVALNMQDTAEEPTHETILLGGTSSMYVSLNNIYITFPEFDGNTTIYRILIENNTINPEAKGKVLGHELNQFSMDEYDDYFRIATTSWLSGTPVNNLYVLDMNLSIVGILENFAPPGEVMDSARFIGNRCYLSTSTPRKDPFFVIDIQNASEPTILGNLSIPGFTRYLHPYDENHVIGIGIDGGNVKITLFDVSDVSAPVNMSEYKIEGYWSDTAVLSDHKAFLFDKAKDLLVIPVSIAYNGSLWQGAYVFNITLTDGLVLKGTVTHLESDVNGWDYNYQVKRALYIEDILYTVSDKKIKMNSLEDLSLKNEIEFP